MWTLTLAEYDNAKHIHLLRQGNVTGINTLHETFKYASFVDVAGKLNAEGLQVTGYLEEWEEWLTKEELASPEVIKLLSTLPSLEDATDQHTASA